MVGVKDTFKVCANTSCSAFTNVIATAKYVGPKGAIFLDDVVPAGGFLQEDIDTLGLLFDGGVSGSPPNMYPIDTTAFGRETDLDGNGAVIILLSPAVNRLSGNCNSTRSVILGFFFAGDLHPGSPGSNDGEIFYGLVPDTPANARSRRASCKRDRADVSARVPAHDLVNQHVLVRGEARGGRLARRGAVALRRGARRARARRSGRRRGRRRATDPVHDSEPLNANAYL